MIHNYKVTLQAAKVPDSEYDYTDIKHVCFVEAESVLFAKEAALQKYWSLMGPEAPAPVVSEVEFEIT